MVRHFWVTLWPRARHWRQRPSCDGRGGSTRSTLFVIVNSHVAHVSSTPAIITLDDGATFSNAHTGGSGVRHAQSSQNTASGRALGFSDDHYDQSQPRYRTEMRQDEIREMWADVARSGFWVRRSLPSQSARQMPFSKALSFLRLATAIRTPTSTKISKQLLGRVGRPC